MQNVEIVVIRSSYGSLKVIGNVAIRYSTYNFLVDFNRNYAYIFYCVRVSELFVESRQFNLPHLHLAPLLE